jgi:hypothetical protein
MEWSNSQKEPTKNRINLGGLGGQATINHFKCFQGAPRGGFKIAASIDLGLFEYPRIRVTGREDDYGGGHQQQQ